MAPNTYLRGTLLLIGLASALGFTASGNGWKDPQTLTLEERKSAFRIAYPEVPAQCVEEFILEEKLISEAREAVNRREYKSAAEKFGLLCARHPANPITLSFQIAAANSHREIGETAQAVSYLQAAEKHLDHLLKEIGNKGWCRLQAEQLLAAASWLPREDRSRLYWIESLFSKYSRTFARSPLFQANACRFMATAYEKYEEKDAAVNKSFEVIQWEEMWLASKEYLGKTADREGEEKRIPDKKSALAKRFQELNRPGEATRLLAADQAPPGKVSKEPKVRDGASGTGVQGSVPAP